MRRQPPHDHRGGGHLDFSLPIRQARPPPHAPAHGYRHKHQNYELEYDSGLELYVVVGVSGRYYLDGQFYRRRGHQWFTGENLNGPWKAAPRSAVPHGLLVGKKAKKRGATAN